MSTEFWLITSIIVPETSVKKKREREREVHFLSGSLSELEMVQWYLVGIFTNVL